MLVVVDVHNIHITVFYRLFIKYYFFFKNYRKFTSSPSPAYISILAYMLLLCCSHYYSPWFFTSSYDPMNPSRPLLFSNITFISLSVSKRLWSWNLDFLQTTVSICLEADFFLSNLLSIQLFWHGFNTHVHISICP